MTSSLRTDEEIEKIYYRHVDTVYRVCFSFMKNAADTEDMVQETFLKLVLSEKQFESERHERAWLIVTASNVCKDELRRWKRRMEKIEHCLLSEKTEHSEVTEDRGMMELILALPEKYKTVIYLYYYEGYHTPEIAQMLRCPEATVRSQLARARKLLKKNSEKRR